MAVRKFQQAYSTDLSAFYDFLNKYKEGTFLENMTISLAGSQDGTENGKIIINDGSNEFSISSTTGGSSVQFISLKGEYVTNSMANFCYNGAKAVVNFEAALLCSKGLILSVVIGSNSKQIDRLVITVDNADKLALIVPTNDVNNLSTTSDFDYYISTYDSTVLTTIKASPAYGMNKTSLAPVSIKALSTDRYLPYAYVAVTTQLAAEGLQTVLIDGAPFITNGIWYIKDPE